MQRGERRGRGREGRRERRRETGEERHTGLFNNLHNRLMIDMTEEGGGGRSRKGRSVIGEVVAIIVN